MGEKDSSGRSLDTSSVQVMHWGAETGRSRRIGRLLLLRGRLLVNRLLGRPFNLRVRLLEEDVDLVVTSARELRRAAEFDRESAFVRRMVRHLEPNDTVCDVGANIGLITLALATAPRGRMCDFHCFEPEPGNFRSLRRNLARNGLEERATAHSLALGDRDGEAELFVRGGPGEGRHSIASRRGATGTIRVPVLTLASFAGRDGCAPQVVKIDVEGAEGYVLAGMEGLMSRHPPRDIFLEIHSRGLRDLMPDGQTIHSWLGSRGYQRAWHHQRRSGLHCHYVRRPEERP
jgi:FkbM family methyltransferase